MLKSKKEKRSGYITQGDPLCCRNNNTSILILFSRREGERRGVRVRERGIERDRDGRKSRERARARERETELAASQVTLKTVTTLRTRRIIY